MGKLAAARMKGFKKSIIQPENFSIFTAIEFPKNMKHYLYKTLVFLVLIIVFLPACQVKKTMKKATEFEAAGMFKDAADMYFQALQLNPKKAEIKIDLKRCGQLYLEELSEEISQSYHQGDYKTTVYDYVAATAYVDKLARVGVNLKIDPSSTRYFEEAKENFLAERYEVGQKTLMEQNYTDAKEIFEEIYRIDPDFRDTKNYLNQAKFEPVYQEASRLYGEGKYMEAYQKWHFIFIEDPNFKNVKDQMQQALNERYKQGSLFLMNENFTEAATALGEVYRADPGFEDVKVLFAEARNEPVYRQGNSLLTDGKCRTAYFAFNDVVNDAGNYKDAVKLRETSLKCAQYPVAVGTLAPKGKSASAGEFQSMLINRMIKQNNLFLKVYDLAALDNSISQSLLNNAGNLNRSQLQQLASKHGLKAVLFCNLSEFTQNEGKQKKVEKTGFERTTTKTSTGQVSVSDRQVKYEEVSQENLVSMTMNYKLISTQTGEILLTDYFTEQLSDETKYASYNGNSTILYPAVNSNGIFMVDDRNFQSLQSLLKAPKNIKSAASMTNTVFETASQKIAGNINNFNPEK